MSERDRGAGEGIRIPVWGLLLLVAVNLVALVALGWPRIQTLLSPQTTTEVATATPSQTPSPSHTPSPTITVTPTSDQASSTPLPAEPSALPGLMVLALSDNGYTHLYAYQPQVLPYTRLTSGDWDDIHPALSPDGTQVAFASHRGGQWDLYVLDLHSGELRQITDDRNYDGAPSWSPDGAWLVAERYQGDNLEIFIHAVDSASEMLQLTDNPAVDFAPAWSPDGRRIAFSSERDGSKAIWLLDLDNQSDGRLRRLVEVSTTEQVNPAWSPDGSTLAWASIEQGETRLYTIDVDDEQAAPVYIGSGDRPAWGPEGEMMAALLDTAEGVYLTGYQAENQALILPPLALPGRVEGLSWGEYGLPSTLPASLEVIAQQTPGTAWNYGGQPDPGAAFGRHLLIDLVDVEAPSPKLLAPAVEPFYALRDRVAQETGWDVLASLENTYVSLTASLPPERRNDWLYTGRALALNPVLVSSEWIVIVREDFGAQTYWRVYLKPVAQDGSMGRPLYWRPWDLQARFTGSTTTYEEGGALADAVPGGYWVDFTALAAEYGWERLPALSNWRSYYQGTLFNEFAITAGLDWETAMLQLYPSEVLTPSP